MGRTFDFIANTGDGVFAVDPRQSIVLWNTKATEILGFTAQETLGKKCYELVCGRDAEGCVVCRRGCEAITAAARLEPSPTKEIAVRTKRGDAVWLSLSTVVAPSRRRGLSVLVHLYREVTREHDLLSVARDFAKKVSRETHRKAIRSAESDPDSDAWVELTRREREILMHLASGVSTETIAERLGISSRTVRNHINNVLGKLGVHSRLEAVAYSIKNGLV